MLIDINCQVKGKISHIMVINTIYVLVKKHCAFGPL